jgi:DNA gyrase subunit A
MLFFTERGKCYWLRVYEIPEGTKNSKGRAIQNMINLEQGDKVRAFINVKDLTNKEYVENNFIILCSKNGTIKKTSLEAYSRPRLNGIIAINIREGDLLLEAKLTNGQNEIIMALQSGRAIRFNEKTVRPMGRNAAGVRGVRLANPQDEVIGMICLQNIDQDILVVSENGYGKKSKLEDYRVTNRGGKGVKTINITSKTGNLIAIKDVSDNDDLMIINRSGIIIRMAVRDLRVMGRATQGVRLINIKEGDAIASVARVEVEEEPPLENDLSMSSDANTDIEGGNQLEGNTNGETTEI